MRRKKLLAVSLLFVTAFAVLGEQEAPKSIVWQQGNYESCLYCHQNYTQAWSGEAVVASKKYGFMLLRNSEQTNLAILWINTPVGEPVYVDSITISREGEVIIPVHEMTANGETTREPRGFLQNLRPELKENCPALEIRRMFN